MSGNAKVYELITDRIIESLDRGVVPWRRPWRSPSGHHLANLVSKHEYRGINPLMLSCAGFSSPWWLTFNQARSMGANIKAGSRGTPVVFWRFLEREEKDIKRQIPFLRYYTVFNLEQTEGVDPKRIPAEPDPLPPLERIARAESIVSGFPSAPSIGFGGDRACYQPSTDHVQMPEPNSFESADRYYSTLFHELTHSTGHESRLNRSLANGFGSEPYAREELVAELGAAFLCSDSGILNDTGVEQSASYIASWRKALTADPRALVVASGAAQKAADLILGRHAVKDSDEPADNETKVA